MVCLKVCKHFRGLQTDFNWWHKTKEIVHVIRNITTNIIVIVVGYEHVCVEANRFRLPKFTNEFPITYSHCWNLWTNSLYDTYSQYQICQRIPHMIHTVITQICQRIPYMIHTVITQIYQRIICMTHSHYQIYQPMSCMIHSHHLNLTTNSLYDTYSHYQIYQRIPCMIHTVITTFTNEFPVWYIQSLPKFTKEFPVWYIVIFFLCKTHCFINENMHAIYIMP